VKVNKKQKKRNKGFDWKREAFRLLSENESLEKQVEELKSNNKLFSSGWDKAKKLEILLEVLREALEKIIDKQIDCKECYCIKIAKDALKRTEGK